MSSYRPFSPPSSTTQSDFVVPSPSSTRSGLVVPPPYNQNPSRPAPPVMQSGGTNQHSQYWVAGGGTGVESFSFPPNYPNQPVFQQVNYGSSLSHFPRGPPRNLIPLEPPQLLSTPMNPVSFYPPPLPNVPPRPPRYYSPSQYFKFTNKPFQPPPPPRAPRSPKSVTFKSPALPDMGYSYQGSSSAQQKEYVPVASAIEPTAGRSDTEEPRRLRYKKGMEKPRHQFKESENKVVQKTKVVPTGGKQGHESTTSGAKEPTEFIGKMKFLNDLPEPTDQEKFQLPKSGKNRLTKYRTASLERQHKPQLHVDSDLGIPLDLLDLSVYNPPRGVSLCLDPEDEELLRDDDSLTPAKKDGLRIKERPAHRDVPWLLKTEYISSVQTVTGKKQSREKELWKRRGSQSIRDNFDMREKQIQIIEASFKACKIPPVHATNRNLHPVEVLPLLPDSNQEGDQFVVATFDSSPTCDSEIYKKLANSVRDAHESQAIMKSFPVTTSDKARPDKFLAYMVPSFDELSKDMYDGHEDISFNWLRNYHWDVRGEDVHDPTAYLLAFGEKEACYTPLPTNLVLRKQREIGGKSSDEVEHLSAPSKVTVRRRSKVSVVVSKETLSSLSARKSASASKRQRIDMVDNSAQQGTVMQDSGRDHSGGTTCNTTRPRRSTKTPAYLADYELS